MYSKKDIVKGINQPKLIIKEINRIWDGIKTKRDKHLNGYLGGNILLKDWDNLIILDGCRYDIFEAFFQSDNLSGNLSKFYSNSSSSNEFFEKNFRGEDFGDIVYLSANPYIDAIEARFHEIFRLWETDWSEDHGTVLPKDAVQRAKEVSNQFPHKKIILHMMQPHRPFLGESAKQLSSPRLSRPNDQEDLGDKFWWNRMKKGNLSKDEVWSAYSESLEYVIPYISQLLEELSGKTVITADHGNMFGESEIFGHPAYTYHKKLLEVPWLVSYNGDRKTIEHEEASSYTNPQKYHGADEQLNALGYIS